MGKKRILLVIFSTLLMISGCQKSYASGEEFCIINPSGTEIKCDAMKEEDLLKIEGTTEYRFTYSEDKKNVFITNKDGEKIFEQKNVVRSEHRTFRATMDADGSLWVCVEKWEIGGYYFGAYRRGYLNGMPVQTDLWQINPVTGEELFHGEEDLFFLTQKDGWAYFYLPGWEEDDRKENSRIIRKNVADWTEEETVCDLGYTRLPDEVVDVFFELEENSITVSGTNAMSVVILEPIIIKLEE
ncbi:MAG: hypothetical protein ACI4AQ_06965 [Lachnospiraceae bacterium]